MNAKKHTVAAIQMNVAFCDLQQNVDAIVKQINGLTGQGIDLAVFPECALSGYCFDSREEALRYARPIDDPLFEPLINACQAAELYAVIGFLESSEDKIYNAQALVGPDGIAGSYRKVHLPGLGVDRYVDPGLRPFAVHAAGDISVGMAICYDSSFPECSRVLSLHGADVIALSTNWPDAARRTAEIVPSARSMENHVYFIAANRVGTEQGFGFCGMSSITGPDGVVLASTPGDEEVVLTAEIDLSVARNKQIVRTPGKHVIDRFADRRPGFYDKITDD